VKDAWQLSPNFSLTLHNRELIAGWMTELDGNSMQRDRSGSHSPRRPNWVCYTCRFVSDHTSQLLRGNASFSCAISLGQDGNFLHPISSSEHNKMAASNSEQRRLLLTFKCTTNICRLRCASSWSAMCVLCSLEGFAEPFVHFYFLCEWSGMRHRMGSDYTLL
jgi:hypothetical protein